MLGSKFRTSTWGESQLQEWVAERKQTDARGTTIAILASLVHTSHSFKDSQEVMPNVIRQVSQPYCVVIREVLGDSPSSITRDGPWTAAKQAAGKEEYWNLVGRKTKRFNGEQGRREKRILYEAGASKFTPKFKRTHRKDYVSAWCPWAN